MAIGRHELAAEQDKDVKIDPANLEISDFPLVKWIANKFDVKLAKEEDTVVHNWSRSNWHEPGHFKHFDSVKNPLDHFYVKETGQVHLSKAIFFSSFFVNFVAKSNVLFHGGL